MAVSFSTTPPPAKKPVAPTAAAKRTAAIAEQIRKDRVDAVNGMFQIASAVCIMTNQWADAGAIRMHGPNLATETVNLADRYENVGKVLDGLSQVGPFTAILSAALPLVLQIAANHKRLPSEKATMMGVVSPEVLESQMRMQVQNEELAMRREMEAMKREMEAAQQEHEKEFATT